VRNAVVDTSFEAVVDVFGHVFLNRWALVIPVCACIQMTQKVSSIDELIGGTPLLYLDSFGDRLYAKVEAANPYSVKDRIAREMINAAEESGELTSDGLVVESTSGNTGIGLASVCAARGYDCVLTMPESMSEERRAMLRALGADLELTPADDGMSGANQRAEEIVSNHDNAIMARQFENHANPAAHEQTTGPEIWEATEGEVDAIVAGVGTGGTITGVSKYIKSTQEKQSLTSVAVEPMASPTITEQCSDGHDIQGLGPGFLPDTYDDDVVDTVYDVSAEEAKSAARRIGSEEGLLIGISGGAALHAAAEYSSQHPSELTVVILPDPGERYLSTDLFQ